MDFRPVPLVGIGFFMINIILIHGSVTNVTQFIKITLYI